MHDTAREARHARVSAPFPCFLHFSLKKKKQVSNSCPALPKTFRAKTDNENFRLSLKVPVNGRCWLSSSFKFQFMCQVSRRGTFSETFLLLRTCSSTTLGGTVLVKLLTIVTHRQTCQLADHRSSLHRRFSPSAIWRSEECQRDPLDPFPIHFLL